MAHRVIDLLGKPYDFSLQGNGETELVSKLSFLRSICKYQKKAIAIWGYRRWGIYMLDFCKKEEVKVGLIVDKETEGISWDGDICTPEELSDIVDVEKKYFFVVAVLNEQERPYIREHLDLLKCEYLFLDMCLQDLTVKIDWYLYFKKNKKVIADIYDLLADQASKDVYYEFIRSIMTNAAYRGEICKSRVKYFENYRKLKDEVFLNVGSFMGDTVFNFIEQYDSFKKVYAVEGDRYNFFYLKKNITILPENMQRKIVLINEYLDADNAGGFRNATLINMDVEGMEKDVLKGLRDVIYENRPVLAVCAYHLESDIVELPKLILGMTEDYCILFRKYPCCTFYNDISKKGELVMYAIPKERML